MTIKDPKNYYCKPHRVISREVFQEDLVNIDKDAAVMHALLSVAYGLNNGAYAIAHSQIEDRFPLRFFVTQNSIIINPKILNLEGRVPSLRKTEGCMSFPKKPKTIVFRHNKIKVEFQTITMDGGSLALTEKIVRDVSGIESEIFQHEIDHMDGKYIYSF